MNRVIRIGTRDSELALWQAKTVATQLQDLGYVTELVPVKSTGDIVLDKPLYELGITGVFTKTLDVAMIQGAIDIAVHSLKDVPTALPKGIVQAAVLERADPNDIIVHKGNTDFLKGEEGTIATGSLRRKAQWLHKFPNHKVVDLRGNVNSRLQKLSDNDWSGAIFANAGLQRINIKPEESLLLDWMIPAPAQGIVMCVASENDEFCLEALAKLNHKETQVCGQVERDFLRQLEGGCTAPIGAHAIINNDTIYFKGCLHALDGSRKKVIEKEAPLRNFHEIGSLFANELLQNGGEELMREIKAIMGSTNQTKL